MLRMTITRSRPFNGRKIGFLLRIINFIKSSEPKPLLLTGQVISQNLETIKRARIYQQS